MPSHCTAICFCARMCQITETNFWKVQIGMRLMTRLGHAHQHRDWNNYGWGGHSRGINCRKQIGSRTLPKQHFLLLPSCFVSKEEYKYSPPLLHIMQPDFSCFGKLQHQHTQSVRDEPHPGTIVFLNVMPPLPCSGSIWDISCWATKQTESLFCKHWITFTMK